MRKERRELVKVLIISVLVMMVLPLVYRVFFYEEPPAKSEAEVPRLEQILGRITDDWERAVLKMPLAKWTARDKERASEIHAWLTAHAGMVLPWEWTEEARGKDLRGYLDVWDVLLDECVDAVAKEEKEFNREYKRFSAALSNDQTIFTHDTNELMRIYQAIGAVTNYPVTLVCTNLTKGRLWGWNRKAENLSFDSLQVAQEWCAAEQKETESRLKDLEERAAEFAEIEKKRQTKFAALKAQLEKCREDVRCAGKEKGTSVADADLETALIAFIKAPAIKLSSSSSSKP